MKKLIYILLILNTQIIAQTSILNRAGYFKVIQNGDTTYMNKPCMIEKVGNSAIIMISGDNFLSLNYSNIIEPSEPTLDALLEHINTHNAEIFTGSYKSLVGLGRYAGSEVWNKWGYNSDIDIGTETIWNFGGLFQRLDTASTFDVVSTSVEDSSNGTGARNIVIYYLDTNRISAQVVVSLTGTNVATTSVKGFGINRVALYNTGNTDSNVGDILVTATTNGTTQAKVPAGEGVTQQGIFFTQAGHTFLAEWLHINVAKTAGGQSPKVTVKGWVYSYVSKAQYLVYRGVLDTGVENNISLSPFHPFIVGEQSILWFECTTDKDNTQVSIRFSGIEAKE